MIRTEVLKAIEKNPDFDVVIIGGGASGIGIALDSVLRGYRTLLVEKSDFTKGTSSRSTKLVHGGVRYLAQGNVKLVAEALRERGYLRKNAPHLVKNQEFIIPNYRWWEGIFYTIGLTLYDLMAGGFSFGKSRHLSLSKTKSDLPGIKEKGLKGGVLYHDGQFDDSRLAIDILHAVFDKGGFAINYFEATGILKNSDGKVSGITATDQTSSKSFEIQAKVVFNATGVWVDDILKLDHPETGKLVVPSQGVHLILDKKFHPGPYALMIPKTEDGRVLFAVPWIGHVLVGTTDTPLDYALDEPIALNKEVDFILKTAGLYFKHRPKKKDVKSVFAGLRPLAAPKNESSKTKEISRSHKILVSESKLITITGGKWTTYRKIAEDAVDIAIQNSLLKNSPCSTKNFRISELSQLPDEYLFVYGVRSKQIHNLIIENPKLGIKFHNDLPYTPAEVIWICRNEMVNKLEDMLSRRLRALFLDAKISQSIAKDVAVLMGKELFWTDEKIKSEVENFKSLANNYILS